MSAVVAAGTTTAAGRTRVTTRALTRVVSAITAGTLDVDAGHVRVDLDDHNGHLAITVHSPVGIPALSAFDEHGPDKTLLDRCADTQRTLKDRIPGMTGYQVGRVTVHLTGATIVQQRRVA